VLAFGGLLADGPSRTRDTSWRSAFHTVQSRPPSTAVAIQDGGCQPATVATASTGVQVVLIVLLILAGLPALGACGWYWRRQCRDADADRRRRMLLIAIGSVIATAGFTGVFTLALALGHQL
jgi:hypothetical protein